MHGTCPHWTGLLLNRRKCIRACRWCRKSATQSWATSRHYCAHRLRNNRITRSSLQAVTPLGPLRRPAQHMSQAVLLRSMSEPASARDSCTLHTELNSLKRAASLITHYNPCSEPSSLLALTAPPKMFKDQQVIITKRRTCPVCSGGTHLRVFFAIRVSKRPCLTH